jgi:hypothetical protein
MLRLPRCPRTRRLDHGRRTGGDRDRYRWCPCSADTSSRAQEGETALAECSLEWLSIRPIDSGASAVWSAELRLRVSRFGDEGDTKGSRDLSCRNEGMFGQDKWHEHLRE